MDRVESGPLSGGCIVPVSLSGRASPITSGTPKNYPSRIFQFGYTDKLERFFALVATDTLYRRSIKVSSFLLCDARQAFIAKLAFQVPFKTLSVEKF